MAKESIKKFLLNDKTIVVISILAVIMIVEAALFVFSSTIGTFFYLLNTGKVYDSVFWTVELMLHSCIILAGLYILGDYIYTVKIKGDKWIAP